MTETQRDRNTSKEIAKLLLRCEKEQGPEVAIREWSIMVFQISPENRIKVLEEIDKLRGVKPTKATLAKRKTQREKWRKWLADCKKPQKQKAEMFN